MKKIVYLLSMLVLFACCKSTKQTAETATNVSEQKNVESHGERESVAGLSGRVETKDSRTVFSGILENMSFTLWSAPDSLGNQYPTATGEVVRRAAENRTEETSTAVDVNLSNATSEKTDLKAGGKVSAWTKTKESEEKKPAFAPEPGFFLPAFAVILIVVVAVLKKKGVIK